MKKHILLFFLVLFFTVHSNNITVSNICLVSQNIPGQYTTVFFNLDWDNSWRNATNHDAAWVFVKYRVKGQPNWQHASISTSGSSAPPNGVADVSSDNKGAFIYRAISGTGSNSFGVMLRWNYGMDGIANNDTVDIFVGAIEMVYVPQGSFYLGDGGATNLHANFEAGISGSPFHVTSENAITLGGGTAGSLGNNNRTGGWNNGGSGCIIPDSQDDFNDVTSQNLSASFPKGYNDFYCMKYELTQGQYVDFLNHITSVQAANRYSASNPFSPASHRYNITGTHPNFTTSTPYLPCTYIEFFDGAAYSDWSGLRPMTELEFEKAARGTATAVAGEFVWGTNTIINAGYTLANFNANNETIGTGYSTTAGNAWFNPYISTSSPVRAGCFAAHALNSGRISAGASYYGIMELSGNCWERAVTVGHPKGRGFTGSHGDGNLSVNGGATNSDWPGYNQNGSNNEVDGSIGAGYRGGGFDFPGTIVNNLRTSSRICATAFWPNTRYFDDSFRAVRTAP